MPWRETLLMDHRVQFIADDQRDVFDVADLARRFGVSRKTAYKWIDRYEAAGPAGLVDRSRRPTHSPNETPAAIVRRSSTCADTIRRGVPRSCGRC